MEADSRRSKLLHSDSCSEGACDDKDEQNATPPILQNAKNFRGSLDVRQFVKLLFVALGGVVGVCTVAAASVALLGLAVFPTADQEVSPLRVAFLGNSITFTNDLPRFMEALSSNKITQNSCLHGALTLRTLISHGNGMHTKWQTENAVMDVIQVEVEENDDYITDDAQQKETTIVELTVYDYGACSVPQLLFGYDEDLTIGNANAYYSDDGKNPCFVDSYYLDYLNSKYQTNPTSPVWDYVILNDQTLCPGLIGCRKRSLRVLQQVYASMFSQTPGQPTPIFLSTYGYDRDLYTTDDDGSHQTDDDQTSTVLGDIPEFTSRIWYGYQQYAAALAEYLPESQAPMIVPVGLAFLTLWEENYDLWFSMFQDDGFHPSPHGTFLMGACLYASLYQRMPSSVVGWESDEAVANLFADVRRFQMPSMGCDRPLPTAEEAAYLANVAERVVLYGHVPSSLLSSSEVAELEAQEASGN